MGRLTTHVLDLARGRPAAGLEVEICDFMGARLCGGYTNADGRLDEPLLHGEALVIGTYEIRFHVGRYFSSSGLAGQSPPFLDVVPVRIGVADAALDYHVPLLVSPYGYSTYRGS